jgi:hypothetical protein
MSFTTQRFFILPILLLVLLVATSKTGYCQSFSFAGDAQHTAVFSVPAQHINAIRWTTPIDTHYVVCLRRSGYPIEYCFGVVNLYQRFSRHSKVSRAASIRDQHTSPEFNQRQRGFPLSAGD